MLQQLNVSYRATCSRNLTSCTCTSSRLVVQQRHALQWQSTVRQDCTQQQQQHQRRCTIAAATRDDEQVESMKREIEQGDVWESEVVSTAFKVALVAGVVAVGVFLFNVGRPMVDNTLQSFPTPEKIQAYEDSK